MHAGTRRLIVPMIPRIPCLHFVKYHHRSYGDIRNAVNNDHGTCAAIPFIRIKHNIVIELNFTSADFIQLQRGCRFAMQRIHVDLIAERLQRTRYNFGCLLEKVPCAGNHGVFTHPYDHRIHSLRNTGLIADANNHIATTRVNFIFEG